ncbi:alpha/beta fold hydrolase [Gimibacter soli]|uniref:Alpha/beta hydrolase n=1 Tax=Gimibacter soli TaxID=3024400 RepID=A0AAE9XQP0_9PROT|nr:alpha/beta hydrolase [Gimibacter soli]WCL55523.1 alpha/beta hydrolase [Gimibacter soli]
MTDWPAPETVRLKDIDLAVYRMGPKDWRSAGKPPVFFLHGFPELAYSWRSQMKALSAAGYPVFAPDLRGYGASAKPEGRENYTMAKLTGDVRGLLDHYGIEKAVLVGHDWGALLLWSLPFYMPGRALGYAGLNVPLMPHYPVDPITLFRQRFGEEMYIVRFQEEGACEPLLEADVLNTFRFFMRKPAPTSRRPDEVPFSEKSLDLLTLLQKGADHWGGEALMSDADLAPYVAAYTAGGFKAPIHWYRNMAANWQDQKQFLDADGLLPKVPEPCLMITAEMDRACPPALADGMEKRVSGPYTRLDLKGCGHWSQQERADDVNRALLDWLKTFTA